MSPTTDLLGRQRTTSQTYIFNSTQANGLEPLVWETRVTGSGTATWDATTRVTTLATGASGGTVVRQSAYQMYQSERNQSITLTGLLGPHQPGKVARIGAFDAKNGLFFELDETGPWVVERLNGVDIRVPQVEWNRNALQGFGTSRTYDPTKHQFYRLDFVWLGIGPCRWSLIIDNDLLALHQTPHSNRLDRPYLQSGNLPLRFELSATGAASMTHGCTSVNSEGGFFDQPGQSFVAGRTLSQFAAITTDTPVIALRPRTTFGGIPNRSFVRLSEIEAGTSGGSADWRVVWVPAGNPSPITGGTWAAPSTQSAVEVNTGAMTATLTNAIPFAGGYVMSAGGSSRASVTAQISSNQPLALDAAGANNIFTSNDGGNPAHWIVLMTAAAANTSGGALVRWEEIR